MSATDAADTATSQTITVTVADVNDITPVYQAADADDAISVNENVGTGSIDAGTITDADTVGTYVGTLSGADAADFACSISGSTVMTSLSQQILTMRAQQTLILTMYIENAVLINDATVVIMQMVLQH